MGRVRVIRRHGVGEEGEDPARICDIRRVAGSAGPKKYADSGRGSAGDDFCGGVDVCML